MQTNPTITLKSPFGTQDAILRDKTRFRVLAIGRRWGKTELAVIACIMRLLRGERMWFCSPTTQNNKRVFPQFKAMVRDIPNVYINNSDFIISLPNGGYIKFVSLHEPDNIRGEGLDFLVIDEAAFVAEDVWDKILRPMLVTTKGAALFLSSPNGRNWFWRIFNMGNDPLEPDWKSWQLSAYDSAVVPSSELDDIKRNTPERVFSQEYLAEFLEDGGAVFRNIMACIGNMPHATRNPVTIGADWARYNDYSVFYAIDMVTRQVVDYDRFNQIDWTLQRDRLLAMAKRWNVKQVFAEANSIGEPNIEELNKTGLQVTGFMTTAASKQQIINALSLAFEQQDIMIPNDPVLIAELQAYTLERLPSGNFRYTAPSGLHDDCVMALAIAWYAVMHQREIDMIPVPKTFSTYRG